MELKENECTTECKSQRRLDGMAPWTLNYGNGKEQMKKGGGEEAKSVRAVCDVSR